MQLKKMLYLAVAVLSIGCQSKDQKQPETVAASSNLNQVQPGAVQLGPPPINRLNPKHGEPGHRCDLAVGAPLTALSSPQPSALPATTPVQAPVTKPVTPTPMPQAATASNTAKGINPPHGQPNHRCDIAVGAPLNAKPTPQVTQAKPNVQPSKPTPQVSTPSTNAKGEKLNPPHGQPNHRCDLAVGAPLT